MVINALEQTTFSQQKVRGNIQAVYLSENSLKHWVSKEWQRNQLKKWVQLAQEFQGMKVWKLMLELEMEDLENTDFLISFKL